MSDAVTRARAHLVERRRLLAIARMLPPLSYCTAEMYYLAALSWVWDEQERAKNRAPLTYYVRHEVKPPR